MYILIALDTTGIYKFLFLHEKYVVGTQNCFGKTVLSI